MRAFSRATSLDKYITHVSPKLTQHTVRFNRDVQFDPLVRSGSCVRIAVNDETVLDLRSVRICGVYDWAGSFDSRQTRYAYNTGEFVRDSTKRCDHWIVVVGADGSIDCMSSTQYDASGRETYVYFSRSRSEDVGSDVKIRVVAP